MAIPSEMTQRVKEYFEAKCSESQGVYQPESIDDVLRDLCLSKEDFLRARATIQAENGLFITRGPRTKYSLKPFSMREDKGYSRETSSINLDNLSTLADMWGQVDLRGLVKEVKRLRLLEEALGKPTITKHGNTVIKTYTVIEER